MPMYTARFTVSGNIEYDIEAPNESAAETLAEAKFWEGVNTANPADCALLQLENLSVDYLETYPTPEPTP